MVIIELPLIKPSKIAPLAVTRPSSLQPKMNDEEKATRDNSFCLNPLSPRFERGSNPVKPIANVKIPRLRRLAAGPMTSSLDLPFVMTNAMFGFPDGASEKACNTAFNPAPVFLKRFFDFGMRFTRRLTWAPFLNITQLLTRYCASPKSIMVTYVPEREKNRMIL